MLLRKTIFLSLAGAFLLASCKKESTNNPAKEDDCVTGNSASAGSIVEGRYILAFNGDVMHARGMNAERLQETSTAVLERNNIREEAFQESFGGEPGGFIARLSPTE